MFIGIKEGKIYDICSDLRSKRDNSIPDKDYLDLPFDNWIIGDTWDSINNISLKDSPQRFEPIPKTEIELLEEKITDLETKNTDFEARIAELEAKTIALEAAKG